MKTLMVLLLLLAACSGSQETITSDTVLDTKKVVEQIEEPIETASELKEEAPSNEYIINGEKHTVEVIDVTTDGKSCLVSIDGSITLIDEYDYMEMNGIKVAVKEITVIHSTSQEDDVCELSIS